MTNRLLMSILFAFTPAFAQSLDGLWNASVVVNGLEIPFKFEIARNAGSFFNGDEKVTSTRGSFSNGMLVLNFDHYGTKLQASFKDGLLEGKYGRPGKEYPFHAARFVAPPDVKSDVPKIAGAWEIEVKSPKGESAWRLLIHQNGADVSAAILRIDGDTGTLTGRYRDGKFVLSHFSGARPSLID